MLYSSRNGCLFYYDSILYSWKLADSTMLFLLGLEAVTSYDKSETDNLTLSKYVYYSDIDLLDPADYMDEIYDSIYSYLSTIGSVEDFETYLKFNCYGIKLLLNEITGTGYDRTIPIIFKSDVNRSLINPTKYTIRLSDSEKSNMSYYDLQANRIFDFYIDAGYDLLYQDKHSVPEYYITSETRNQDVINYDSDLLKVHDERLVNSEIYRLLDFKSMYSYSLGVLYGCRCLGFDDSLIWRIDPLYWYTGDYVNLVRTAWYTFRFHWTNKVGTDDTYNSYQSIQENKIWNFDNEDQTLLRGPSLLLDENDCYCLCSVNGITSSQRITYSESTEENSSTDLPGSYLSYNAETNLWEYISIENIVPNKTISEVSYLSGIISSKDSSLTRYLGNDLVTIYRAYSYNDGSENDKYLSPHDNSSNYYNYYVYTGSAGWIKFNQDYYYPRKDSSEDPYLSLVPKNVDRSYLRFASQSSNSSHSINESLPLFITYYKATVGDSPDIDNGIIVGDKPSHLYGIYDRCLLYNDVIPDSFDLIISDDLFESYIQVSPYDSEWFGPDKYYPRTYYDLDSKISLVTRRDSNTDYIFDPMYNPENPETFEYSTGYYGYTTSPSTEIKLYRLLNTSDPSPKSAVFRYCNSKYWSLDFFNQDDPNYRQWINQASMPNSLYKIFTRSSNQLSVTSIYKGEMALLKDIYLYVKVSYDSIKYIYADRHTLLNDGLSNNYGFISLEELYSHGITTNACKVITKDDNGNSLLDENGNPLVWFDCIKKKYWNGLDGHNEWQTEKPVL